MTDGPAVSTTYPLGYFREDYLYTVPSSPDYLDENNGRFCVTPEYPAGTYAYFCTVDDQWNSAYPYAVGPTFYGNVTAAKVTAITETVTSYTPTSKINDKTINQLSINVFPNPSSDLIAIQLNDIIRENINIELFDINGRLAQQTQLNQGSTIAYFDTRTLYNGNYIIRFLKGDKTISRQVSILR